MASVAINTLLIRNTDIIVDRNGWNAKRQHSKSVVPYRFQNDGTLKTEYAFRETYLSNTQLIYIYFKSHGK